jgi:hypothetical protein
MLTGLQIQIRISITFGGWIRIRIRVKSWIRIHVKVKFRSLRGSKQSHGGLKTFTMKAWRLKMKSWWSKDHWSQIPITLMRSMIRIHMKEKSLIRILI